MKPLALLIAFTLPAAATNVIFMMADDLGYMDVGFNNPKTFYETPNLDSLASQGLRFTSGYAACPVCSPTRSSILTGQYPARTKNTDYFGAPNGYQELPANAAAMTTGNFGNQANRPVLPAPYLERLAASHITMAEAFRAKGYATMSAGKWHLGKKGSWPEDHGFDVNIAGTDAGGPYGGEGYFSPYNNPRLPDGPDGETLPDRLAAEVSKFIIANRDRPFFIYFPFYSVHTPLMAPQELIEKYKNKREKLGLDAVFASDPPREVRQIQEHAIYAAMVEEMDRAVGKVLRTLDENKLTEDTIVVFFSDNGGLSTAEGSPTSNLPYRAGKGWIYEGGIREPLVIRWPKTIKPGGTCETPIISTDFFPTFLQACGFDLMPGQHKDGTSNPHFPALRADPLALSGASRRKQTPSRQ
jgi:arylsulfatase A-like enzyme